MDYKEFNDYLDATFREIININRDKGTTYTLGTNEKFRNFQTIADDLNLDQKMVLWVYLRKHLDAILHRILSPGQTDDNETTQSRIQDCMLYLAILGAMFEEESNAKADPP